LAYVRALLPDAQIEVQPGRFVMAHDFDRSLAKIDLGWEPRFSMEEGIRTYINLVRTRHGLPPVEEQELC
jgi:nucleoside-diphosphate-sugar epimerase